jgi:hypothetical protein
MAEVVEHSDATICSSRFDVRFEALFEGKLWPEEDSEAALLGRMGKRDDGKFWLEVVVRTAIENKKNCHPEFWYVGVVNDPAALRRDARPHQQGPDDGGQ